MRRKTPMRKVSRRRQRTAPRRRRFVQEILASRPVCEAVERARSGHVCIVGGRMGARQRAADAVQQLVSGCDGRAVDVHELKRRSQGGDILDVDNVLAVCRSCHEWIGAHPYLATALGLSKPSYT